MRILLFITSIYNTFENIDKDIFQEILNKLKQIADIEQDQVTLISFCDETKNKNIIISFYRLVSECNDFPKLYFGRQFLGDLHYKGLPNSGALLYDEPFNKSKQIYDYVKSLEEDDNYINLYYIDSNMNIEEINELFKDMKDVDINLIKNAKNGNEIINSLKNCIEKKKLLRYE